jgi:trk system potassium uptake protein
MNVIVVGCGRVGSQLATLLSIEGNNVVVIDKTPRRSKARHDRSTA